MSRDPEVKAMPNGNKVCAFGIATNESYTNREGEKVNNVEFHNVIVYGKHAENCGQYLRKGQLVMVEGKSSTRSWEKDGIKLYKTEVIAFSVQFGPKAAQGASNGPEPIIDADTGAMRTTEANNGTVGVKKNGLPVEIQYPTEEINPDDIPF